MFGERSRAEASFANLTKRIDQNTTLSLTYVPEDKPAIVNVIAGTVYFFSRKPRVLEVDTPFFDAAVEGTEFLVRVEPERGLLTVLDGKITARNAQGELTVASGESLAAEAGQAPAPYVLVRPRDAVRWALYYSVILFPLADRSGVAAREIPSPLGEAVELASRGAYMAAFARFDAIPEYERGPEFYLYRAGTLLSVGRVEEARADIDQALVRDPTDGRAYALSAVIAVAQNERDRALEEARRGVELSPRSAAAKIALSYAEQAQFQIEQARDTMQQAVEDEPDNALAWARLSELWLMAGYRDRALKTAKKARKLAPELERVEATLGFAALAAIDIGKAKKAFGRAIELDSADPQARFGLGLATIRDGELDAGRKDIELAVGLDPNDSLLRSYLGKAYFDERTTDPVKYLRELFTNFPNQENTLAAEQFAIAKRLDPNDPTPWFYDAIRKQSENRPVEALHDIEKSIELNDNRAVYRSRELLDQDQAARGTSLARIYNDLGFEQLGINEATKSLSIDPANAAAHRFLSDAYATQPRREISRVSELLQAQLLQDININPIQPSLSVTNLNIITSGGPARPAFNEFTPLFERNQAQLNASGEIGSNDTFADEAVVSGIYDRFSVSGGQFYYHTDGFRHNFRVQQNLQNLFAQAAISPEFNVQAEVTTRRTEEGDIRLNFDPAQFTKHFHRDVDQDTARVGLRLSPSPNSDVLASFIYSRRNRKTQDPDIDNDLRTNESVPQGEMQYILRYPGLKIIPGLSAYSIDLNRRQSAIGASPRPDYPIDLRTRGDIDQNTTYVYSYITLPPYLTWTLGLSYDNYDEKSDRVLGPTHVNRVSPKVGLECDITPTARLRLSAFETVKPTLIANRTIQPTQIAGFNQFFDDRGGTTSWLYGAGLDMRLTETLYGGVEFSWRDLDVPVGSQTEKWDEKLYSGYLYWTPFPEWSASVQSQFEAFDSHSRSMFSGVPRQMETTSFPLAVRYFSPLGIFAGAGGTYVHQSVRETGNSSFVLANLVLGYRFPQRRGLIAVEVNNLLNSQFRFQDYSFRSFGQETHQHP